MNSLVEKFNLGRMANRAVKGAALGAGVGLVWWLGKQLIPSNRPLNPFDELNDDANAAMCLDAEVRGLCERMRVYKKLDEASYSHLLLSWALLLSLVSEINRQEIPIKLSLSRKVALYIDDIVACIRRLRAILARKMTNNVRVLAEFDEIAGDMQTKCNQYSHNANKALEYALMVK